MLSLKKSSDPDFFTAKILHKLDLLLGEQVNQRKDLSVLNAMLKSLIADFGIQKQVDQYYEHDTEHPADQEPD